MLLFPFLAMGTVWFWGVLFLSAIIISCLIDDDSIMFATLMAIGTFFALALLGNLNPIQLIRDNPGISMMIVPVYLFAGTVWGVVKWSFFVRAEARKIGRTNEQFDEWLREQTNTLSTVVAQIKSAGYTDEDLATVGQFTSDNFRSNNVGPNYRTKNFSAQLASASLFDLFEVTSKKVNDKQIREQKWNSLLIENGYRQKNKPIKVRDNKARILAWMSYWPASMLWTIINDPVRRFFEFVYENVGGYLQKIADNAYSKVTPSYNSDLK